MLLCYLFAENKVCPAASVTAVKSNIEDKE